jgi:hypothetical protein
MGLQAWNIDSVDQMSEAQSSRTSMMGQICCYNWDRVTEDMAGYPQRKEMRRGISLPHKHHTPVLNGMRLGQTVAAPP